MTIHSISTAQNRRDANAYRCLQAAALIKLFKADNGHPPNTTEELEAWVKKANLPSGPIQPYNHLTNEEVAEVLAEL